MFYKILIFIVFTLNSFIFANSVDSKNSTQNIESKNIESSKTDSSKNLQNIESNSLKTTDSITQDSINSTNKDNKDDFLKDYEISTWRYVSVIFVMVLILIILYVIRLRQNKGEIISNITLEQAKILDSKNKVAIIKYDNKKYLIGLNPNGITLIDKIYENHNFNSHVEQGETSKKQDSKKNNELENTESNPKKPTNFETMLESKLQNTQDSIESKNQT
ncbi:hypothetical protein DCO58_07710 [Helicobacter saguini]|uniref:Flagellar protein n=1 Tax=Helicobacter saguini TaxID=1548018 RepID=A0A347W4N1_9HELI|nr:flagellar biosynthetic protein FliO [Helicobacter saguini]MWV61782.1 hypothetical protein [Helicobacter saguini]MWV67543.1 hypothetical protein [Helicobacter saguini]MWV69894.1 hypothetical protein [Helicobacter saguini]MWV72889.1 hypothetical protein [Helicobacter saguini]TLD93242.1 hypothetical protein LS64_009005 [Helicobacter saguini]